MESGKIQAVVFDLYGTLIYIPDGVSVFRDFFRALGLPAEDYAALRRIIMTENFTSLEAIAARLKPDNCPKIDFTEFNNRLEERIREVGIYEETVSVLDKLKQRGLKIGLISNLSQHFRRPFFDFGLDKYFDQLVFSFEAGFVKPHPELYRIMIDRLGVEPQRIIMTGDQFSKDVEAPRAAGMQAVHLDRLGKSPDSILTLDGIFQHL